jgi:predicted NBD/HSP70 family sugar kinase
MRKLQTLSLGIGIATVLDSLDPEAVIVGGDIGLAWELIEPIIQTQVKARALSPAAAETFLEISL